VATIGGLMIPAMLRSGYTPQFAGAVAVSGGALGILIPPSNPFLMYGIIARQSIAKLFLAGVIPGIIMTAALSVTAVLMGKTKQGIQDTYRDERPAELTFITALKVIYDAKWALLAIIMLLGGIYAGLFTPIEAAEVTIFYTLIVGLFITRKMRFTDITKALSETVVLSGTLIILVAASTAFGRLITLNQIPAKMGTALQSVSDNPTVILFIIMGIMIFVGTWAETFSQIVVLTPIFLPIILRLKIDPIHFGVLFVVCAEIGFLTPPFGANLFVGMKLTNLSIETMSKSVLPYIVCYIIVLALLVVFPSLSTVLPNLVFGK
jgi:C4-dicarboxylate transporter DctM subunit